MKDSLILQWFQMFIKPTAFVTVKFHKENWAKWGIKIVQPVVSCSE